MLSLYMKADMTKLHACAAWAACGTAADARQQPVHMMHSLYMLNYCCDNRSLQAASQELCCQAVDIKSTQPKFETDLFKTAGTMHMCSRLQWQSIASMTVLKIRRRNSSKQACGRRTKGSQGVHDKIDPQQLDDSQGRLSFRDG